MDANRGGPAPLPQTKQEATFYPDDDGELMKGVVWPSPRFTPNGDGTVTDNLTGLIWTEFALLSTENGDAWTDAMDFCAGLADSSVVNGPIDGSTSGDWRLPNVREALSIVDYGVWAPPVSDASGFGQHTEGDPFTGLAPGRSSYWTSTTVAADTTMAWTVFITSSGVVGTDVKTFNQKNTWCVRDPLP